jgi:hypothetical protein
VVPRSPYLLAAQRRPGNEAGNEGKGPVFIEARGGEGRGGVEGTCGIYGWMLVIPVVITCTRCYIYNKHACCQHR